ncbi:MAG: hypothetical protein NZM35_03100 [Chitinophagales bacterium]|nr:hypothetical protein [Chitinophagales bacterium]MDW8418473.1 hypothetical protein [Chitinophagales bacterium]
MGKKRNGEEHKRFNFFWRLDPTGANTHAGIQIGFRGDMIDTVFVAGHNCEVNGIKFREYEADFPYKIKIIMPPDTLLSRFNGGTFLANDLLLAVAPPHAALIKFYRKDTIEWIKFFSYTSDLAVYNTNTPSPSFSENNSTGVSGSSSRRTSLNKTTGRTTSPVPGNELKDEAATLSKADSARSAMEKKIFSATGDKHAPRQAIPIPKTPMQKAILEIFQAYRESNLASIRGGALSSLNPWYYRYTYASKVTIPGASYTMLYRFPFEDSQLDVVAVVGESGNYDEELISKQKIFAQTLKNELKSEDGWVVSKIPDKDNTPLDDLEFRHPKLGSVILDSARGKGDRPVVYVRFLFYGN